MNYIKKVSLVLVTGADGFIGSHHDYLFVYSEYAKSKGFLLNSGII